METAPATNASTVTSVTQALHEQPATREESVSQADGKTASTVHIIEQIPTVAESVTTTTTIATPTSDSFADLTAQIASAQATQDDLHRRLTQIRQQRRQIQARQQKADAVHHELILVWNAADRQRTRALDAVVSARSEGRVQREMLAAAQRWDVTANDAFYIAPGHRDVATINGLRLGMQRVSVGGGATTAMAANGGGGGGGDDATSKGDATANNSHHSNVLSVGLFGTSSFPFVPSTTEAKAPPWKEINAALGHVALLISTLEQRLDCKLNHQVQPVGSTSKIGLRKQPTSLYNLYYNEDAFSFFAKRNFNTALQYLLESVLEASDIVLERDRSIVLPYTMEKDGSISGLSVAFFENTPPDNHSMEQWSRAMKYLLTNLKYLMIYRGSGFTT